MIAHGGGCVFSLPEATGQRLPGEGENGQGVEL